MGFSACLFSHFFFVVPWPLCERMKKENNPCLGYGSFELDTKIICNCSSGSAPKKNAVMNSLLRFFGYQCVKNII